MPREEQQRAVLEHVRRFATSLQTLGLDDLAAFRRAAAQFGMNPTLPSGVTVHEARVAEVPCVWIIPQNEIPGRVAVHAHGGGFMLDEFDSHEGLLGRLALATRCRIVLPRYRLAPEHRFPAALEDVLAVYAEITRAENDSSSRRWRYLMGDSCGGGLAIAAAVAAKQGKAPLPDGIIALGLFADLTASGSSYTECAASDPIVSRDFALLCARTYLGNADPRDPRASSLFADLSGLPPILLQASSAEVLRDDSTHLAERAREAGVVAELQLWPDMVHVWHHFAPTLQEAEEAIAKVGTFVESVSQNAH